MRTMTFIATAAAVATVNAFASSTHYNELSAQQYHETIRRAFEDKRDGVIVAFVNETADDYEAVTSAFNTAASTFDCLYAGGVHMMECGEGEENDGMARFIAQSFAVDNKLTSDVDADSGIEIPFVSYFRRTRAKSWHAGNWTTTQIRDWALSVKNIRLIEHSKDWAMMRRTPFAIGVFPSGLCSEESKPFRKAVIGTRAERAKMREPPLELAVITDELLAKQLVGSTEAGPGLYVAHTDGSRVRYPDESTMPLEQIKSWLLDMTGSGGRTKDEV